MNDSNRRIIFMMIPASLLSFWLAFSAGNYMSECKEAATEAAGELAEVKSYVSKLALESKKPSLLDEVNGVSDIRTAAEKLAKEAGIKGLKSVDRRSDRRVGDTDCKERICAIRLLKVSPIQMAKFAYGLSVLKGLDVSLINMQSIRSDSVGDLWNVDLEFAYLIYSPVE